jgi:hypothetical protein
MEALMERDDLRRAADPAYFPDDVRAALGDMPKQQDHHQGPMTTVRTVRYMDHEIVIRTTYEIEVDGRPLRGHIGVSNAGSVHTHTLPNYSFPSAVDMVRQLIDAFPQDFPPVDPGRPEEPEEPDGGHHHHGG